LTGHQDANQAPDSRFPGAGIGRPIDLARAALFLASGDRGFVTGHGFVVEGGLMLRV
jgi:NAD(P)-dependent dehydrogenase (short-subunit alcohol dehydrogenase family)